MTSFPKITVKRQNLYEKNAPQDEYIPKICGIHGRACRCMDKTANSALCRGCSLAKFCIVGEMVINKINEFTSIGREILTDSDILDICESLNPLGYDVTFAFVSDFLDNLSNLKNERGVCELKELSKNINDAICNEIVRRERGLPASTNDELRSTLLKLIEVALN